MLDSQLLACTTAPATTTNCTIAASNGSGNGNGNATALTDCLAKVRKPYTITKQREKWTEEEHDKFLEALKLHGRAWRNIEDHVGTKTAVQIRSHAQKFFFKLERKSGHGQEEEKEGVDIEIPPPRPKRKPTHPYPRKAAASALIQDSVPISTTSTSTSGMLYSTLLPSLSPLIQDPPLIPPPSPAPPVQAHPSLSCFRLFGQTVEVVSKGGCGSESSDSTSDIIDSNTKVIAGSHEASHGLLYHPLVAAAESSLSLFANTCHKEGETGNPKLDSLHHSGGCFKPWHLPKTGIEAKTESGKAPSDGDGYVGFDSVAWWALNRTTLLASADGCYFQTGPIQPEKAFFSDDDSLCSKTVIMEEEENTPKRSRGNDGGLYDHRHRHHQHHHHHRRLLYHCISMGNDSGSVDQNSESEGEGEVEGEGEGEGEEEEDTVYSTGLQCMGMAKVLSVQCYKTDPTNKEEEEEEEDEEEGGIVGPFFGSRGLSRLAPSGFSPYQAPT